MNNTVTTLITIAILAWSLQIIFSWFQIYRFNQAFSTMKRGAYIGVGRNQARRFQARVLVAVSLDEKKNVIDSLLMKGLTVFARPEPINAIYGMNLTEIDPKVIFPGHIQSQNALTSALSANQK